MKVGKWISAACWEGNGGNIREELVVVAEDFGGGVVVAAEEIGQGRTKLDWSLFSVVDISDFRISDGLTHGEDKIRHRSSEGIHESKPSLCNGDVSNKE